MDPKEANTICRQVIRSVLKKLRLSEKLQRPDLSIILLISQLESRTARRLATELALWACAQSDIDAQTLDEILTERDGIIRLNRGGPLSYWQEISSVRASRYPAVWPRRIWSNS